MDKAPILAHGNFNIVFLEIHHNWTQDWGVERVGVSRTRDFLVFLSILVTLETNKFKNGN